MVNFVRNSILNFFEENGVCIDVDTMGDVDLREYLLDSMQYIYFLVELERILDMELPDEVLFYDNLSSLIGFSNRIEAFIGEKNEDILNE